MKQEREEKIASNQERRATTTGCVLNQQHREGERVEINRDEAKLVKREKLNCT